MKNDSFIKTVDDLKAIQGEQGLPKNVQQKITFILELLQGEEETKIKVSKALQKLEELIDAVNTPSLTRTELYDIVSRLELE